MGWCTVALVVIASACFTLAAIHAHVWFRERGVSANGAFAALAASVGVMAFLELQMLHARTPAEFGRLLWWNHVPIWLGVVSVVDGKTTYQDRPCDPTDKDKGMMTSDTVQSKNNRTLTGITVVSREENLRRAALAKRELEPLARDAYAAMRDGNMNAWAQMLCPQVKLTFQRGPLAGMVKQQGAGYAKRKVELTGRKPAVGFGRPRKVARAELLAGDRLEQRGEAGQAHV